MRHSSFRFVDIMKGPGLHDLHICVKTLRFRNWIQQLGIGNLASNSLLSQATANLLSSTPECQQLDAIDEASCDEDEKEA